MKNVMMLSSSRAFQLSTVWHNLSQNAPKQCHFQSTVQYFSIPNVKYLHFGPINVQKGQLKTVQKLSQIAGAKKISAFISTKSLNIQRSHNLLRLITIAHWTYLLQILSKSCFQRVAFSGNYKLWLLVLTNHYF